MIWHFEKKTGYVSTTKLQRNVPNFETFVKQFHLEVPSFFSENVISFLD